MIGTGFRPSAVPTARTARNNFGVALIQQGRWEEVLPYYHSVLRIDATDAGIYNNICVVLNSQKKPRAALPYCQKALDLQPDCQPCRATWLGVMRGLRADFRR